MTTKTKSSHIRLIVLCFFYLLFLVVGASIFSSIEGPLEREQVKKLRHVRSRFLQSNRRCLTDEELESFIIEIIDANNRGVSAIGNVSSEPNWSIGQSMFFAGTILTTIGYGHVTPLSEGGKVFAIVYALIGIPLTLIMFTALVERIMILTTMLLNFLNRQLNHLYKPFNIRMIHLSIVLSFLIVFIFVIPAAIFMAIEEDWNYLDAFYYCFISMTTIGLGDYIPGDKPNQPNRALYKICTTFYLFFGLIAMMLVLANIYDIPELNIGFHFYMKSDDDDSERVRLRTSSDEGVKYTKQIDEPGATRTEEETQGITQAQE